MKTLRLNKLVLTGLILLGFPLVLHAQPAPSVPCNAAEAARSLPGDPGAPELAPLQLFPNPAISYMRVETSGTPRGEVTCMLLDLQGRVVRRWWFYKRDEAFSEPLRLDGLDRGIYLLEVRVDGACLRRKVALGGL